MITEVESHIIHLVVGLTIGRVDSISRKVTVGFSKYFLWKVVMSFKRSNIADFGF